MVKCSEFHDNCQPKTCVVKTPVTMKDIDAFFNVNKSVKCDTTVVYLNRYKQGTTLNALYVKQVDEDCHIFYTVKNGYYFVYPNFMHNILLWSQHPNWFGIEGFLGNHISIGSKDGTNIDIHETIYTTFKSNQGNHTLIASKLHCYYYIGVDNKTLTSNNCSQHQLAQVLWDDICCSLNSPTVGGTTTSKQKHHMIVKNKRVPPLKSIAFLTNLITKYVKKTKDKDNHVTVFRLPYIRPFQLEKIKKKLAYDDNKTFIVTNTSSKSSVLGVTSLPQAPSTSSLS